MVNRHYELNSTAVRFTRLNREFVFIPSRLDFVKSRPLQFVAIPVLKDLGVKTFYFRIRERSDLVYAENPGAYSHAYF